MGGAGARSVQKAYRRWRPTAVAKGKHKPTVSVNGDAFDNGGKRLSFVTATAFIIQTAASKSPKAQLLRLLRLLRLLHLLRLLRLLALDSITEITLDKSRFYVIIWCVLCAKRKTALLLKSIEPKGSK